MVHSQIDEEISNITIVKYQVEFYQLRACGIKTVFVDGGKEKCHLHNYVYGPSQPNKLRPETRYGKSEMCHFKCSIFSFENCLRFMVAKQALKDMDETTDIN